MVDPVLFTDEEVELVNPSNVEVEEVLVEKEVEKVESIPTVEEITKEWLEQKYIQEDLGVYEISLLLKILDTKLISNKLIEFNIPKKPKGRKKGVSIVKSSQEEEEKEKITTFNVLGMEFEIGDRFYTKEKINNIRQDALVTVINVNKQGEVLIRDQYTYMKKYWVSPESIYPI